ncbi:hypothetical protein [Clostridium psychrophilum]|uniref:hypothetical protein n=1 Tax=Clostridium psychrophilum TaxID=132926 RepID=UPI001C0DA67E|nr:hypothetical protein [Clostridium psychrophilum]MBU3179623.1 hypothetical protein [Clostridium psychrophilum]
MEASSLPSSISGTCLAYENYFGGSLNLLPKLSMHLLQSCCSSAGDDSISTLLFNLFYSMIKE